MSVGWVTALGGLGLAPGTLKADLTVPDPLTNSTMQAFGVLESFSWNGGVTDPLQFAFYVSQATAVRLEEILRTVLKSSIVDPLNFLIAGLTFNTSTGATVWFTQVTPEQPLEGNIASAGRILTTVGPTPVTLSGLSISVYKVTMQVYPPGSGTYAIKVATSPTQAVVQAWG